MFRSIKRFFPTVLLVAFILSLIFATGASCTHLDANSTKLVDNSIKIAHLSDVHFELTRNSSNKRLLQYSKDILQDAIDQINQRNVDMVVFSGDQINSPISTDLIGFNNAVKSLKAPWYAALGNHDIGIFSAFNKKVYMDILHSYNNNIPNSPYYAVSKKGYLFLFMDGVITDRITANGYFYKDELQWLDKELTENKNEKAIIVQHYPIVEPFKSSTHKVLNAEEYLNILSKHKNVIAVLSGHYHGTKIRKVGNIVNISTPALVEYPDAFRIITIDRKNHKIYLNIELVETRLKNLQDLSKSMSKSTELQYGDPKDRNASIVLDDNE